MTNRKMSGKRKIGVCLESDIVAWLDDITYTIRDHGIDVSRSNVVNVLLRSLMRKRKPEEIASRILKLCTQQLNMRSNPNQK